MSPGLGRATLPQGQRGLSGEGSWSPRLDFVREPHYLGSRRGSGLGELEFRSGGKWGRELGGVGSGRMKSWPGQGQDWAELGLVWGPGESFPTPLGEGLQLGALGLGGA